jgi:hypothetical protein
MVKRDDEHLERYPATWPFPVGSWALPVLARGCAPSRIGRQLKTGLGQTETKQPPLGYVSLPLSCRRIGAVPRTVGVCQFRKTRHIRHPTRIARKLKSHHEYASSVGPGALREPLLAGQIRQERKFASNI